VKISGKVSGELQRHRQTRTGSFEAAVKWLRSGRKKTIWHDQEPSRLRTLVANLPVEAAQSVSN